MGRDEERRRSGLRAALAVTCVLALAAGSQISASGGAMSQTLPGSEEVSGGRPARPDTRATKTTVLADNDMPSASAGAPAVIVQVGDVTLHVPGNYIDRADGFQGKLGYLNIHALLPCLLPETSQNTAEFHKNTFGAMLTARISLWDVHDLTGAQLLSRIVEFNDCAKHAVPNAINQAENEEDLLGTGFHLYKDIVSARDIFYLTGSDPSFLLDCLRPDKVPYPSCSSRSVFGGSLLLEYR
jgi:hypothetical protein